MNFFQRVTKIALHGKLHDYLFLHQFILQKISSQACHAIAKTSKLISHHLYAVVTNDFAQIDDCLQQTIPSNPGMYCS